MPTASSAQMRKSVAKMATHRAIRYSIFFTFLNTSSLTRPVLSSRMLITRKSKGDQFTSLVNCIARKGMSNKSGTERRMMMSLLFWVIITAVFECKLKVL